LLLSLSFNGLPNIVTDQAPQSHLILGTGNFIDTHLQLLFFYLLEKNSGHLEKSRPFFPARVPSVGSTDTA
jgi:hypothetical protein